MLNLFLRNSLKPTYIVGADAKANASCFYGNRTASDPGKGLTIHLNIYLKQSLQD